MAHTSSRMLTLLSLLQTGRDWPGDVIAGRLDVSVRTVRRDIDRLRELGYRIRALKGPAGGYRLEAGSELPPLLFDDDQAIAVAVALQSAPASGAQISEAASRALATVRQVMPPRLRHRIDNIAFVAMHDVHQPAVDPRVLVAVNTAVHSNDVLRFDYRLAAEGAGGELRPSRRVEPHHIATHAGRWYLLGWDLDRADWRVFRLDRMTPRIPTGPRFEPRPVPGGDVARFLAARFRGSGTESWPCVGEVVVELPARAIVPFEPDAIVAELAPDRSRVVTGSWSWTALAAALGRYDAPITVIGPPELARAFAELSERFASAATTIQ